MVVSGERKRKIGNWNRRQSPVNRSLFAARLYMMDPQNRYECRDERAGGDEHRSPIAIGAIDVRLQQHGEEHLRHDRFELLHVGCEELGARSVLPENAEENSEGVDRET